MMKKRWCILVTAAALMFSSVPAFADEEDDLRAQQQAAQAELTETNETLDRLAGEQQKIQSEISDLNKDIVDLMVRIDEARQDVELAQEKIGETNVLISETAQRLGEAEATRDKQYEDMKVRIKYIYEQGGNLGWASMIFGAKEADSIADYLNRAEYSKELHEYDRRMLTAYMESVDEAAAVKEEYEGQLEELKDQKAAFKAQKEALEENEKELEKRLEEAKAENEDYEAQITEAKRQAEEIEALIGEMQREIERVQEEKRKAAEEAARKAAEEEARRKAEEEARQKAAEEEALRKAALEAEAAAAAAQAAQAEETLAETMSEPDPYGSYDDGYGNGEGAGGEQGSGEDAYGDTGTSAGSGSQGGGNAYVSTSGVSGAAIVAYADQFVGCPYVWGGNSLTNGCDCSHFVWNVLRNCGVYSGGYSTSGGWAYLGSPVASLSQAQAGDVIVYSGHVAIYDGYGCIVEAQSPSAGITHYRAAASIPIVAIRRFI